MEYSNTLTIAILYFGILLLTLVATYTVGHFIWSIIKPNSSIQNLYLLLFCKCIIGATFIILVVSLFYSKGRTINLLFILLFLFYLIEKYLIKKQFPKNSIVSLNREIGPRMDYKFIFGLLIVIIPVFIWRCSLILQYDEFPIRNLLIDNCYYAEISKCLVQTGFENTFITSNLISNCYQYPTPYHYYELWFNGFVSKAFNLSYTLSLYLVTFNFFTILLLIGFLGVINNFCKVKWFHKVFVLFLLFIGGIHLFENSSFNYIYMEGVLELFGEKMAPIYCFGLLTLILFILFNHNQNGLIVLLSLPIISIGIAPAVFLGVVLFCIYKIYNERENWKPYFRMIYYYVITIIVFILFYFLNQNDNLSDRFSKPLYQYTDLSSFSGNNVKFYIVELFFKCFKEPFYFTLHYLPFLIVVIYLIKKGNRNNSYKMTFILFGFIWISAYLFSKSVYLMNDASHFFSEAIVLWHILFGVSIIIFFFNEDNRIIASVIVTIILSSSFLTNAYYHWHSFDIIAKSERNFSKKYVLEVNKACNDFIQNTKGAVFNDETYVSNLKHPSYFLEYRYLPFIMSNKVYPPFDIRCCDDKKFHSCTQNSMANKPFARFFEKHSSSLFPESDLKIQIDFIKENNITYLVCPKSLDIDFNNYLKVKSEISDANTGQRFIVLK